jgi:transitional endoplasmic reticulum ATPase
MTVEISEQRELAQVRTVSDDQRRLYIEYASGKVATAQAAQPLDLNPGDVVLVGDDSIDKAPNELWPSTNWTAVVRKLLGPRALVAGRGEIRLVDTNGRECSPGDTVEVDGAQQIVSVIANEPFTYLDSLREEDIPVDRFKPSEPKGELTFQAFGGQKLVKQRAQELVELQLERREALTEIGARAVKGVLFSGPPGTGKTMLARVIASRTDATFYEVSGPQIFSKWFGESEATLRAIFEDAATQDRSIVFFDEIDSVAPARGGDSHEASRRVVAQLLTEMDGFKPDDNVVVIAATNRPEDIDPALRRPGRFDWEIDFPLPALGDRAEILRVSAANLQTANSLIHDEIASRTEGWSSADLTAIWTEAALLAIADDRKSINNEDYFGGYERVGEQRSRLIGPPAADPEPAQS